MPKKSKAGRLNPGVLLMLTMVILTSCATRTASVETKLFCDVAWPITWHADDTDQTIREVKAHNRVGKDMGCADTNPIWETIE